MDASTPEKPQEPKPTMYLSHTQVPAAKDMMPGDEVHLHVHGKVKAHRQDDENKGETTVEIHSVDHDGKKKAKKSNAAHAPIDELKEVIKKKSESDKEY